MKEVRNFIISILLLTMVQIVGGLLCQSYSLLAYGLYDLLMLIYGYALYKKADNKKYKGILTSLLGIIFLIGGIAIIFSSFLVYSFKPSWFLLIFIFIGLFLRYMLGCYYTNINYQKKKGILGYGVINSTLDFIMIGIVLGSLILYKIGYFVPILRYTDKVGCIVISGIVIYKSLQLIYNSFNYLEDRERKQLVESEITSRDEVKKITKVVYGSYGGIRYIQCNLNLREGLSMIDINSFVVTLQDYLLKYGDIAMVYLTNDFQEKKVKPKVRSLKQDARNSRSRNSKTSTKKKNTKKKNKKR